MHLLFLIGWVYERMKIWIWWLDGIMPVRCLCTCTLFYLSFPCYLYILPAFMRHLYETCYKKKDLFFRYSLLLRPSYLFAFLHQILYYHTNNILTEALCFLFSSLVVHLILIQRVSRYSWWLVLHMHPVVFYLNYKLLVKCELKYDIK